MKISMSDLRFDGPENAKKTVVLAHGAGASMDSEFLEVFAEGLAANGLRVYGETSDRRKKETPRSNGRSFSCLSPYCMCDASGHADSWRKINGGTGG